MSGSTVSWTNILVISDLFVKSCASDRVARSTIAIRKHDYIHYTAVQYTSIIYMFKYMFFIVLDNRTLPSLLCLVWNSEWCWIIQGTILKRIWLKCSLLWNNLNPPLNNPLHWPPAIYSVLTWNSDLPLNNTGSVTEKDSQKDDNYLRPFPLLICYIFYMRSYHTFLKL